VKTKIVFLIIGVLAWLNVAGADTIFLKSAQDSIRGIKIVSFKQGRLEGLEKQGERKDVKYEDIAILRVDGQVELNAGEKFLTIRQYDQAIASYRKALIRKAGKNSWMDLWVRVRLMNLYANQGKADEATQMYINLAKEIPDWALAVAPKQGDIKGDAAALERAGTMLVKARDENTSTKVRETLAKFYERLGCKQALPEAKPVAVAGTDEKDFETFDQPGPWLDGWAEKKVKSDDAAAVLRVTGRLYTTSLRRNLPAVFYWRGRAELAGRDFDHAALSFLRVAIEFPASSYVPEALFYASQAAEQAGRSEYAKKIRMELIDTYNNSNDYRVIQLVEQARDLLSEKE
jgi:tetratricopeptide (TPR) repeat protein